MVGKVLCSTEVEAPGMLPADLPSHSYRKRSPFEAGCSIILTCAAFFIYENMMLSRSEFHTTIQREKGSAGYVERGSP